jgi:hypothetical protein
MSNFRKVINQERSKPEVPPPEPSLKRQSSSEQISEWFNNDDRKVPPEYEKARSMCCVNRKLLKKSSVQSVLDHLDRRLNQPEKFDENELEKVVKAVTLKAYGVETQDDIITGNNILDACKELFKVYGWRQKYFILGLFEVEEFAEPGTLIAILSEFCRTSELCLAGQRFGFMSLMEVVKARIKLENAGDALDEFLERYVNEYVSKAFRTAILEPSWAYFIADCAHSSAGEDAEQHAINLHSALCVAITSIPVTVPHLEDEYSDQGFIQFLECKDENYLKWLEATKDPENFGKNYAAFSEFKEMRGKGIKRDASTNVFFTQREVVLDKVQLALSFDEDTEDERAKVAKYMEFFMYFFSKEFFVPKFINYVPKATQQAFQELRGSDSTIEEEDFRFWIWDSLDGKLHFDRAERLLKFCDIII